MILMASTQPTQAHTETPCCTNSFLTLEQFRVIRQPYARVLTGCSTGGWGSLALQVYYQASLVAHGCSAPTRSTFVATTAGSICTRMRTLLLCREKQDGLSLNAIVFA